MTQDIEFVESEIECIKRDIEKAYNEKDYFKTICMLRFITNIYYVINNKLTDDYVELVVKNTFERMLGTIDIKSENDKKILFYDGFGILDRGLANIYVEAFLDLGYEVEWILYEYEKDVDLIQKRFDDVNFFVIPKINIMDRIEMLKCEIIRFSPKHIFIYTTPDDVSGLGVMTTIKGDVYKYLIDLTDHAYWLGKEAADYFLGFRNNGCNVANKYRHINLEKIIMMPYYPEKRSIYEYKGLPFEDSADFIFSGGSSYKIEGAPEYSEIVIHILNKYKSLYFVYACDDENEPLKYLKKMFPDRFFVINERKDLDDIMKRAKFYLHTYPMCGGLMVQYAVQNGCVPFGLCIQNNGMTDPKTFLLDYDNTNISSDNIEDVYRYFDKMMDSNDFYIFEKNRLEKLLISEENFRNQLSNVLMFQKNDFEIKVEDVDMRKFFEINSGRMSKEKYLNYVHESRNKWIMRRYEK